jgi:histidyl-tRNA synthetase
MKIKSIKGVKDILPGEIEKWQWVESVAHQIFSRYGFKEIRPPIFEYTHLFKRSIGDTTDIVEKEMYTFTDKGGEEITLRPEGTASVVRSYIEHKMHGQNPLTKLYYFGPMFRYERPQAGRFRQFYQIGVEAMGSSSPAIDAEVMTLLVEFFKELGLNDLELQINSLGCKECRPQYREILKSAIEPHLKELCTNFNQRYERNPLRVLDCKVPRDGEIARDLPKIKNHLCSQCEDDFAQVQTFLDAINTPYTVNDQIVRGLDY